MSQSLSEFWKSLEQQAVPHVRAEVEKRGWRLVTAEAHRFGAVRGREVWDESGNGPYVPCANGLTASDLLEKIDCEERCIRRSPTGLEIAFVEPPKESP